EELPAPTFNDVKEGDTTITGKGEAGDTVYVYVKGTNGADDVLIGHTTVGTDGTWSLATGRVNLYEGDQLYAYQTNGDQQSTNGTTTVLPKPEELPAPTFDGVKEGDTTITGKGEAGDTVYVYVKGTNGADDVLIGHTTVGTDGTWSLATGRVNLYEGDQLYAYQTNGDQQSPNGTTVVQPRPEEVPAPTFAGVKEGDTTIKGQGEAGDTVYVYVKGTNGADDIVIGHTTVDSDGNWTLSTGRVSLFAGDELRAYQVRGDQQGPEGSTIVKAKETVKAPGMNDVTEGDPAITGTGEPGATVNVTVGGQPLPPVTVGDDGKWSVDTSGVTLTPGDEVSATQTVDGNTSDATTTTVQPKKADVPVPGVNPVKPGAKVIKGSGMPGDTVTVVKVDANGKTTPIGTATVDKYGDWTVNVPDDVVLAAGDTVRAVQTTPDGDSSDPTEVTVG
ncbi:Ig-like domain-containing protein, partial [Pediococcus acidilactici]